ncbi:PP2C family protein-serine/threonine phosphatase [Nocardia sp. NPDC059240]|uniref:PP2C family protein-serine/threonine phosphatase n=1 Tax=Nocardia sp. NPDC059240 TaxID=3346786 RepID=UPI00369D956E
MTHRGLERRRNEDSVGWNGWSMHGHSPAAFAIELDVDAPTTLVVCDGLGGHSGGLEASRLACEILTEPGILTQDGNADTVTAQLAKQLQHASDVINDISSSRTHLSGMGCAIAGATILADGHAIAFSLGDSRCYRVEGQRLARLTADRHRTRGAAVRQALGAGRRTVLRPEFETCRLPDTSGLLLCSGGLHNFAHVADIARIAAVGAPDVAARLRDLALSGGGGDNITVAHLSAVQPMAGANTAP